MKFGNSSRMRLSEVNNLSDNCFAKLRLARRPQLNGDLLRITQL